MPKKISKFDFYFSDTIDFFPEGHYLSKNLFTQEEALKEFRKHLEREEIDISEVICGFVRFQPTPADLREEGLSEMAWITCEKKDRNAQPCWVYGV